MGGRGANSIDRLVDGAEYTRTGARGVDSYEFFNMDEGQQIDIFKGAASQKVADGIKAYAFGNYEYDNKGLLDDKYGISDFIDSDASKAVRVTNNPVLYRGGSLTDEEYKNLKVGATLEIMHSKDNLTSWTDREMVAHMYAEEGVYVRNTAGERTHNVVIVDTSKTSDGIVDPYLFPQNEVLRSRRMGYTITKIVDASEYDKPIGREREYNPYDYYTSPVTYVYVKSKRTKARKKTRG